MTSKIFSLDDVWAMVRARDEELDSEKADHQGALLRERRVSQLAANYQRLAAGYRDALAELAGAIPIDHSYGDSSLMQALGQANLVLQEGPA